MAAVVHVIGSALKDLKFIALQKKKFIASQEKFDASDIKLFKDLLEAESCLTAEDAFELLNIFILMSSGQFEELKTEVQNYFQKLCRHKGEKEIKTDLANREYVDTGWSIFHFAAQVGDPEKIKFLFNLLTSNLNKSDSSTSCWCILSARNKNSMSPLDLLAEQLATSDEDKQENYYTCILNIINRLGERTDTSITTIRRRVYLLLNLLNSLLYYCRDSDYSPTLVKIISATLQDILSDDQEQRTISSTKLNLERKLPLVNAILTNIQFVFKVCELLSQTPFLFQNLLSICNKDTGNTTLHTLALENHPDLNQVLDLIIETFDSATLKQLFFTVNENGETPLHLLLKHHPEKVRKIFDKFIEDGDRKKIIRIAIFTNPTNQNGLTLLNQLLMDNLESLAIFEGLFSDKDLKRALAKPKVFEKFANKILVKRSTPKATATYSFIFSHLNEEQIFKLALSQNSPGEPPFILQALQQNPSLAQKIFRKIDQEKLQAVFFQKDGGEEFTLFELMLINYPDFLPIFKGHFDLRDENLVTALQKEIIKYGLAQSLAKIITNKNQKEAFEIVKSILDSLPMEYAQTIILCQHRDRKNPCNYLFHVAIEQNPTLLEYFIFKLGPLTEMAFNLSDTPALHHAIKSQNTNSLEILLKYLENHPILLKRKLLAQDRDGNSPLHVAVLFHNQKAMDQILAAAEKAGVKNELIQLTNNDKLTFAQTVALEGDTDTLLRLAQQDIKILALSHNQLPLSHNQPNLFAINMFPSWITYGPYYSCKHNIYHLFETHQSRAIYFTTPFFGLLAKHPKKVPLFLNQIRRIPGGIEIIRKFIFEAPFLGEDKKETHINLIGILETCLIDHKESKKVFFNAIFISMTSLLATIGYYQDFNSELFFNDTSLLYGSRIEGGPTTKREKKFKEAQQKAATDYCLPWLLKSLEDGSDATPLTEDQLKLCEKYKEWVKNEFEILVPEKEKRKQLLGKSTELRRITGLTPEMVDSTFLAAGAAAAAAGLTALTRTTDRMLGAVAAATSTIGTPTAPTVGDEIGDTELGGAGSGL